MAIYVGSLTIGYLLSRGPTRLGTLRRLNVNDRQVISRSTSAQKPGWTHDNRGLIQRLPRRFPLPSLAPSGGWQRNASGRVPATGEPQLERAVQIPAPVPIGLRKLPPPRICGMPVTNSGRADTQGITSN